MIIRVASFTDNGAALARKIEGALSAEGEDVKAYAAPKIAPQAGLPSTDGITAWTKTWFERADALLFIGAAGIAVRAIAPYISSKHTDPAVLCMDERGRFVVPLLSGHEGGANRLARKIAKLVEGSAVLTTATDVNGRFAVDEWIARNGYTLLYPENVRQFATNVLKENKVGILSDFPIRGKMPEEFGSVTDCGLYVGIERKKPFLATVQAVPRIVTVGIGCRRGTEAEKIRTAIEKAFEQAGLEPDALEMIASINLKEDEVGLIECAREMNVPIRFFSSDTLNVVSGSFTPSERVLRITGVDNVCERAAVCASSGRLILSKCIFEGVTAALAVREVFISFEEEYV